MVDGKEGYFDFAKLKIPKLYKEVTKKLPEMIQGTVGGRGRKVYTRRKKRNHPYNPSQKEEKEEEEIQCSAENCVEKSKSAESRMKECSLSCGNWEHQNVPS